MVKNLLTAARKECHRFESAPSSPNLSARLAEGALLALEMLRQGEEAHEVRSLS